MGMEVFNYETNHFAVKQWVGHEMKKSKSILLQNVRIIMLVNYYVSSAIEKSVFKETNQSNWMVTEISSWYSELFASAHPSKFHWSVGFSQHPHMYVWSDLNSIPSSSLSRITSRDEPSLLLGEPLWSIL